jgi:hypothetical protein
MIFIQRQPAYSINGLAAGGYAYSCRFGTSTRHISVCTNLGHVFRHGGVYSVHIHLSSCQRSGDWLQMNRLNDDLLAEIFTELPLHQRWAFHNASGGIWCCRPTSPCMLVPSMAWVR